MFYQSHPASVTYMLEEGIWELQNFILFSLPGLENPQKSYEKYLKTSYIVFVG